MEARTATAPTASRIDLRSDGRTVAALVRRAANELLRVPGAAIPGLLAPSIFYGGLVAVFGNLTLLPGFDTDSYQSFLVPVSMMQGAGFTGAAAGVNLARDIETGLFDRFLASPAPRPVLLAGLVLSSGVRTLLPVAVLLAIAFSLGAHFPGIGGLLVAVVIAMVTGVVAALWGAGLALRFRTQAAAPLMQAGAFVGILTTTAYAPLHLLTGWLQEVARYNPLTQVVEAARQGFLGSVTWAETWPGLVALAGLLVVLAVFALRGMQRATEE